MLSVERELLKHSRGYRQIRPSLAQGQVIWAMDSGDLPVQGLGTVAASQGCPVHGQNEGAKGQSQHSLHSVTTGWFEL